MNQVALLYILSHDAISTCIPGSKSIEQLKSNILTTEKNLSNNELEKIKEIQLSWEI